MQLPPKVIFVFCTDGRHQGLLLDCYLFCVIKVIFKPRVIKHNEILYCLRIRVIFENRQVKGNRETIYLWLPPGAVVEAVRAFNSQSVHLETPMPLKNYPPWKCAGFT